MGIAETAPVIETPLVRGYPLIGSVLGMAKDPARFFLDCYREYGPVFRVKILSKTYTVIAGVEAANFLGTREGKECLRSKEFWQGLVEEYGATRTLTGEDGLDDLAGQLVVQRTVGDQRADPGHLGRGDRLGGELEAHNAPTGGARVRLCLPLGAQAREVSP